MIEQKNVWNLYLDTYPFKNGGESIASKKAELKGGIMKDYLVMTLNIANKYESKGIKIIKN